MTKTLLIVAATDLEIKPLLHHSGFAVTHFENLKRIQSDKITIDVLVTNMGMVATSYQLTRILSSHSYNYVINAGICGAFNKDFLLGDVVQVTDDIFPEIGVDTDQGLLPLTLGNAHLEKMLVTALKNENPFSTPALQKLKEVKGITVNTISGSAQRIDFYRKIHTPDVESMEGAAFLYVCNAFNQPCAQIRSISNYVGTLNKMDWNIELAANNLADVLLEIVKELGAQEV